MLRTRRPLLALVVLVVLLAGGYLLSFADSDDPAPDAGRPAGATASATRTAGPVASRTAGTTAAGTVSAADLPPEAQQVLRLIDAGGPFPYAQDGTVFGNLERLLPAHPRGWYREYTVPTPGEGDRGARRIIAGRDGVRYYTADHYDSFVRIDP